MFCITPQNCSKGSCHVIPTYFWRSLVEPSLLSNCHRAILQRFQSLNSIAISRVYLRLRPQSWRSQNLVRCRAGARSRRGTIGRNWHYISSYCRTHGRSRTSCPVRDSPRKSTPANCRSARVRKSSQRVSGLQILLNYRSQRSHRYLKSISKIEKSAIDNFPRWLTTVPLGRSIDCFLVNIAGISSTSAGNSIAQPPQQQAGTI